MGLALLAIACCPSRTATAFTNWTARSRIQHLEPVTAPGQAHGRLEPGGVAHLGDDDRGVHWADAWQLLDFPLRRPGGVTADPRGGPRVAERKV
jgi:hypothetical protein